MNKICLHCHWLYFSSICNEFRTGCIGPKLFQAKVFPGQSRHRAKVLLGPKYSLAEKIKLASLVPLNYDLFVVNTYLLDILWSQLIKPIQVFFCNESLVVNQVMVIVGIDDIQNHFSLHRIFFSDELSGARCGELSIQVL